MTTSPPAGRPSLAASAAVGACVGLAIGSAYVAGALARASAEEAEARMVAGAVAAVPAAASVTAPLLAITALPARLTHVDLRGPVAPARDLECLSQAVYYEARGEVERGRQAVAQVVVNRTRQGRFPRSICGVVFQHSSDGCAFAFACDGQTRHAIEPAAWREARRIAQRTLAGFTVPELGSATDFRSGGYVPRGLERVAQIGAHVFYRWTGRGVRGASDAPAAPLPVDPSAAPASAPTLVKADAPIRTGADVPSPTPAA